MPPMQHGPPATSLHCRLFYWDPIRKDQVERSECQSQSQASTRPTGPLQALPALHYATSPVLLVTVRVTHPAGKPHHPPQHAVMRLLLT
jgi:hypothetical protein